MSFVDFPIYVEYYTVLVRPQTSVNAELHLKPFKREVWLSIVAAVVLVGVSLSVTSLIHHWKIEPVCQRDGARGNWINVVREEAWLACTMVLLQGKSCTV